MSKKAVFYYPWFDAVRWDTSPPHIYPFIGKYDSIDENIIRLHIAWMKYAGIDMVIVSYWLDEHEAAKDVWAKIAGEMNMDWCYYFEQQGRTWSDRQLRNALRKIDTNKPNYIFLNNKPLLFVFGDPNNIDEIKQWKKVGKKWSLNLRALFNWQFPSVEKAIEGTDIMLHSYQVNDSYQYIPGHSLMITAGYWHSNSEKPELLRDIDLFKMLLSVGNSPYIDAPYILILSWNEFTEGSNVEPDTKYEADYIKALKEFWN